jgi:hypothetical protein
MAVSTTEDRQELSIPQRYWLVLCILVAIFSPIVVGWLDAAAHHLSYKEATEQRSVSGGSGGSTPSGGAVPLGDSSPPGSVNAMTPSVHTSDSSR